MMESELSLEKLKIVERLTDLEKAVALSTQHSMDSSKRLEEISGNIQKILEKHDHEIYGNEKDGLKTHVDRLLQSEIDRRWQIRTIFAAIVGVVVKFVVEFVHKK